MRYPISSQADFRSVPGDATQVHLVRPLTKQSLEKLLRSKPIDTVFLSKSTKKRLGKKAREFLKKRKVKIVEEKMAGRAISIELRKVQELVELHKDYRSFRKIEEVTGIPKSTVHYLIKYAHRTKIKKGQNIIYL